MQLKLPRIRDSCHENRCQDDDAFAPTVCLIGWLGWLLEPRFLYWSHTTQRALCLSLAHAHAPSLALTLALLLWLSDSLVQNSLRRLPRDPTRSRQLLTLLSRAAGAAAAVTMLSLFPKFPSFHLEDVVSVHSTIGCFQDVAPCYQWENQALQHFPEYQWATSAKQLQDLVNKNWFGNILYRPIL